MDCREAQQQMENFIEDKMDEASLDAFINHIHHCPSCYDDLEVYYMIMSGIKQLDDDEEEVDFVNGLKKKLQERENWLKHEKRHHIRKSLWIAFGSFLMLLMAGSLVFYFYLGRHDQEKLVYDLQHSFGNVFSIYKTPKEDKTIEEERAVLKIENFADSGRTMYFKYIEISGKMRLVPAHPPDVTSLFSIPGKPDGGN